MVLRTGRWLTYLKSMGYFLIMVISISTIHGFNHITRKGHHPVERLIWIVLVACAAYEIAYVSNISLGRYRENPTVISMERDRYFWNTSFPAATVCPLRKLNEEFLDDFLKNTTDIIDKDLYRKFVTTLLNSTYENLDQLVDYENMTGEHFVDIIKNFSFIFLPALSSTLFSDIYKPEMSISELGVCYSYNSQLAVYNSLE